MKPPFSYYGGKQKLAKRIISMMPPHRVYVEPFAGGAAVFWAKAPSHFEVLNDKLDSIVTFYRCLRSEACFRKLLRHVKHTIFSESDYKLSKQILKSPRQPRHLRAWALWYNVNISYGNKINAFINISHRTAIKLHNDIEQFSKAIHARLRRAIILNREALFVIQRYDSAETFFYIDPPYFNADMGHYGGYTAKDFQELLDVLGGIKGKFLLSSYPSDILSEAAARHGWRMDALEMKNDMKTMNASAAKAKVEVLTYNYRPPGRLF